MLDTLLHQFVTLFVTADPIGLAPMFVVLTSGFGPVARRRIAIRASLTAAAVLVAAAVVGEPSIALLGITIPAFQIAGGLLLFAISFEMVFDHRNDRKQIASQSNSGRDPGQIAIFPLAVPLIAGPAALSATILLASQNETWTELIGLIGVIALLLALCFVIFILAGQVDRLLGATGRLVVTRLLGVVLAALAVQFVADGITHFVRAS